MLDVIILFFLCRGIRRMAIEKNLSPLKWILFTIISWFVFEGIGFNIWLSWNGISNVRNIEEMMLVIMQNPDIILISLLFAFGGYLIVRKILENYRGPSETN